MSEQATSRGRRRELIGTVKSAKMEKTVVVDVVTLKPDAEYKKYVKSTKRVMAHDEASAAKAGDRVRLVESRPLSKRKRWRLVEVMEKSRGRAEEGAEA